MEKTKSLTSQGEIEVFESLLPGQMAKFLDEVMFAMTVYRRRISECTAWTSLVAALTPGGLKSQVFMYDNSPASQDMPHSIYLTSHYQHDASNPGISKAYNAAYRAAKSAGKRWLLFLDQDTHVDALALSQYSIAVNANPSHSLFAPTVVDSKGMLSPFRFRNGRSHRVARRLPFNKPGFLPLHKFRAINAGLLVSCDLFGKAGGYEQAIELDFSDIAFLEKVKPACDSLCLVDAILEQEFSGSTSLDRNTTLERFKKYNEGARQFARRFGHPLEIRWGTLLRATKLALQWRSREFIRIHFKTWNA